MFFQGYEIPSTLLSDHYLAIIGIHHIRRQYGLRVGVVAWHGGSHERLFSVACIYYQTDSDVHANGSLNSEDIQNEGKGGSATPSEEFSFQSLGLLLSNMVSRECETKCGTQSNLAPLYKEDKTRCKWWATMRD